jgi:hypothetical protein
LGHLPIGLPTPGRHHRHVGLGVNVEPLDAHPVAETTRPQFTT